MSTAEKLMTPQVITVPPETPPMETVNILLQHNFNGLPVVDNEQKLIGLITEYDLIIKGTSIHLPTFIKLMNQIGVYQQDKALIKNELKEIMSLKVTDAMNNDPLTLPPGASLLNIVGAFTAHHKVNPIPIVDGDKKLQGIISRSDMLKFMGDPTILSYSPEVMERNVDTFIDHFDKRFTIVTRVRTRWWLVASLLFALVGFLVAWFLILRINF